MDNHRQKLIFIGGIGKPGQFGGELSKNKLIINRLEELGYDIITLDTAGASRNPFKLARLPWLMLSYGKDIPVVYSTSFANIKIIIRILSKLFPFKNVTYWAIGGRIADFIREGRYRIDDFSSFSHIFVEGHKMVKELNEMGLPGLRYVPNFKQLNYTPDISEKTIAQSDTLRCVFLSRIIPQKGVRIILDACRKLADRNFTVDFYGSIEESFKDEFLQHINQLPNANYAGTLDFFKPEGLRTLSAYHLTLFPTFWIGEGFPGVVIDSLSAGIPLLSSDWNFMTEIIKPEYGFLFHINESGEDNNGFINRLEYILDNRESLNPMFRACQEYAQEFDVRHVVSEQLAEEIFH